MRQVWSFVRKKIGESYPPAPGRRSLIGHPCPSHLVRMWHMVWVVEVKAVNCGRVAAGLVPVGGIHSTDYQ